MYARLIRLNLSPNDRAVAETVADAAAKLFRASPGYKSGTWIVNEQGNEYGGFTVWESKEALESATAKAQPIIQEKLGSLLKSPPTVTAYEVYEPKA